MGRWKALPQRKARGYVVYSDESGRSKWFKMSQERSDPRKEGALFDLRLYVRTLPVCSGGRSCRCFWTTKKSMSRRVS